MEYEKAKGIEYRNELLTIVRAVDKYQPIYEAFNNAWEAIGEKFNGDLKQGRIDLEIYVTKELVQDVYHFHKISIIDNGIGLNEENYERLVCLRDTSKKRNNRGTGRVQFLHYFDETTIESIYKEGSKETRIRKFTLSKREEFLKENAILRKDDGDNEKVSDELDSRTAVTFKTPLYNKKKVKEDPYSGILAGVLKEKLIRHFLWKFCDDKKNSNLPNIYIRRYINDELSEDEEISFKDIPDSDGMEKIKVKYSKFDGNKIIKIDEKKEEFELRSFVLPKDELTENAIYLVSKGEIARSRSIALYSLAGGDDIKGKRYMFLLSGGYIDKRDSDDRGNIKLISAKEFKEQNKEQDKDQSLPGVVEEGRDEGEVILKDDIENETNKTILKLHKEINDKDLEKQKYIDELEEMFLLDHDIVRAIRQDVRISETAEDILRRVYKKYIVKEAKRDAGIKSLIEEMKKISTTDEEYQKKLQAVAKEIVRVVPLQNRNALCQYVARRKLVLVVFNEILEKVKEGEKIKESILHNLIFQQNQENSSPESSDLWLINEEFIYFDGVSERKLKDMKYKGKKIFHEKYSEDIEKYLDSNGQKRLNGRPDILLFPEDGKCIIIELKAPHEKIAKHLRQINTYATLLRNYTTDEFQITSFYGYLIGENMNDKDIRGADPQYKHSPLFDYWYKPPEDVAGFEERQDGTIYSEILKYSSLLKRAGLRNKIFIDKLLHGDINPLPLGNP